MDAVNFAELNELAGELLPERTVLSTVVTPFNNWNPGNSGGVDGVDGGGSSSSSAAAAGGSGGGVGFMGAPADHGFESQDACNTNDSPESNSGLLGLFTSAQENTTSCIPASSSGSY